MDVSKASCPLPDVLTLPLPDPISPPPQQSRAEDQRARSESRGHVVSVNRQVQDLTGTSLPPNARSTPVCPALRLGAGSHRISSSQQHFHYPHVPDGKLRLGGAKQVTEVGGVRVGSAPEAHAALSPTLSKPRQLGGTFQSWASATK